MKGFEILNDIFTKILNGPWGYFFLFLIPVFMIASFVQSFYRVFLLPRKLKVVAEYEDGVEEEEEEEDEEDEEDEEEEEDLTSFEYWYNK